LARRRFGVAAAWRVGSGVAGPRETFVATSLGADFALANLASSWRPAAGMETLREAIESVMWWRCASHGAAARKYRRSSAVNHFLAGVGPEKKMKPPMNADERRSSSAMELFAEQRGKGRRPPECRGTPTGMILSPIDLRFFDINAINDYDD
jgi:hypothetical protein